MMRTAWVLSMLLGIWLSCSSMAAAEVKRGPLGLPVPPATEQAQTGRPTAQSPSLMQRAWFWAIGMQQKLTRDMARAVKDLKGAGGINAASLLIFIAFIYGILHAAGPGHGKAIISSYVLANERTVRRGIFLSFLAAFLQALSAIAIVGILAIALNATSLTIKATESWIETLSWGLVALIGAWMLATQVRKLLPARAGATHSQHGHGSTHDHAECCGHAHMPPVQALDGNLSWKKAFAIAGSIGIRPCTGAIIVLIFALSQGLFWAGVLATFAMSVGTAITTSALAALAVGSKELATRYAGEGSVWAGRIGTAAGLTGSTLVLVMGTMFFLASLSGSAPL